MNWAGYTRNGAEFDARDALRALGLNAYAPSIIEVRSRGKNRQPQRFEVAALPRLVFIQGTPEQYHNAVRRGDWPATHMTITDAAWFAYVRPYIERIDAERADQQARLDAGEKMQHFEVGQELEAVLGPFKGQLLQFVRSVDTADGLTRILAEADFFGGKRRVEMDPLHVRKTG
jgi:hypothetical protein